MQMSINPLAALHYPVKILYKDHLLMPRTFGVLYKFKVL